MDYETHTIFIVRPDGNLLAQALQEKRAQLADQRGGQWRLVNCYPRDFDGEAFFVAWERVA